MHLVNNAWWQHPTLSRSPFGDRLSCHLAILIAETAPNSRSTPITDPEPVHSTDASREPCQHAFAHSCLVHAPQDCSAQLIFLLLLALATAESCCCLDLLCACSFCDAPQLDSVLDNLGCVVLIVLIVLIGLANERRILDSLVGTPLLMG
jgi:hypothetical protein